MLDNYYITTGIGTCNAVLSRQQPAQTKAAQVCQMHIERRYETTGLRYQSCQASKYFLVFIIDIHKFRSSIANVVILSRFEDRAKESKRSTGKLRNRRGKGGYTRCNFAAVMLAENGEFDGSSCAAQCRPRIKRQTVIWASISKVTIQSESNVFCYIHMNEVTNKGTKQNMV